MKHYYSIANFMVGTFTNIFNKFFYIETDQTNQQLLGEITAWSQGNNAKCLFNKNTIPQQFVDSWGADLAKNIADEFINQVINLEDPSDTWNEDLLHTTKHNLSLPQFIMDFSTITTIGAGILDTINYCTNYILLSWISPIGLPNIIWQNVKEHYEMLSLQNVLGGLGAGVVLGLGAKLGARVYASEIFILSMVDIIKISSLDEFGIRQLVEKFCIDSIKPLHEAGVEIYYHTAEEIETNNTTDTYDTLEGN